MTQRYEVTPGLVFERLDTGDVALETEGHRTVIGACIWASLVLTMTKFNERPSDWQAFLDHHHGRRDWLESQKTVEILKNGIARLAGLPAEIGV